MIEGKFDPDNVGKNFRACIGKAQSRPNVSLAKAQAHLSTILKAWAHLELEKIRLVLPLLAAQLKF